VESAEWMVRGSTAFAIRPQPLPHHVSCYSKSVTHLSGGLTPARTINVCKASSGSSTRALYAAVVKSVNGLWCSNDDGVTSYTQLDNAKTRFSLTSGMVLTVDPIILNR
jgi:hypothetical protein